MLAGGLTCKNLSQTWNLDGDPGVSKVDPVLPSAGVAQPAGVASSLLSEG